MSVQWPTATVELDHVELVGVGLALARFQEQLGLDGPQLQALAKIRTALNQVLDDGGGESWRAPR